jgi:hypothetical protein
MERPGPAGAATLCGRIKRPTLEESRSSFIRSQRELLLGTLRIVSKVICFQGLEKSNRLKTVVRIIYDFKQIKTRATKFTWYYQIVGFFITITS